MRVAEGDQQLGDRGEEHNHEGGQHPVPGQMAKRWNGEMVIWLLKMVEEEIGSWHLRKSNIILWNGTNCHQSSTPVKLESDIAAGWCATHVPATDQLCLRIQKLESLPRLKQDSQLCAPNTRVSEFAIELISSQQFRVSKTPRCVQAWVLCFRSIV